MIFLLQHEERSPLTDNTTIYRQRAQGGTFTLLQYQFFEQAPPSDTSFSNLLHSFEILLNILPDIHLITFNNLVLNAYNNH